MSRPGSELYPVLESKSSDKIPDRHSATPSQKQELPLHKRQNVGQYTYESFGDVVLQIKRLSENIGGGLQRDFDDYVDLRNFYLSQGLLHEATCIENVIKNHVGIRRLVEDHPELKEVQLGKVARFHEGRLLGWRGDENDAISLPGIIGYEL